MKFNLIYLILINIQKILIFNNKNIARKLDYYTPYINYNGPINPSLGAYNTNQNYVLKNSISDNKSNSNFINTYDKYLNKIKPYKIHNEYLDYPKDLPSYLGPPRIERNTYKSDPEFYHKSIVNIRGFNTHPAKVDNIKLNYNNNILNNNFINNKIDDIDDINIDIKKFKYNYNELLDIITDITKLLSTIQNSKYKENILFLDLEKLELNENLFYAQNINKIITIKNAFYKLLNKHNKYLCFKFYNIIDYNRIINKKDIIDYNNFNVAYDDINNKFVSYLLSYSNIIDKLLIDYRNINSLFIDIKLTLAPKLLNDKEEILKNEKYITAKIDTIFNNNIQNTKTNLEYYYQSILNLNNNFITLYDKYIIKHNINFVKIIYFLFVNYFLLN